MKLFHLTFILFAISTISLFGQINISATIIDQENISPLEYVNVGILNQANGTITDKFGKFKLSNVSQEDSIKVTYIGYSDITLSVSDIPDTLKLKSKSYKINEVQISGKKFGKEKTKGINIKWKTSNIGYGVLYKTGHEFGTIIKIKKESYIKSAHFQFASATTDSIKFRVNIYEFEKEKLGSNLLRENVFIYSAGNKSDLTINLSNYGIVVNSDVLLTLEPIECFPPNNQGNISYWTKRSKSKGKIYIRKASQSKFHRDNRFMKFGIGFYLKVKEVK